MEDGTLLLSPLYDLMSTVEYGGTKLAMSIDNVRQIAKVTGDRLINEASRWGMAKRRIVEVVEDLLARVPDAIARACSQIEVPDTVPRTIENQLQLVRTDLRA